MLHFLVKCAKLFTMMDIKIALTDKLQAAGMAREEAHVYAELIKEPTTHLQLSRRTGINRTKVYRLVGELEKRGLVNRKADDSGTVLVAGDPAMLEIAIANEEKRIAGQRQALSQVKPMFDMMSAPDASAFAVYTYEGHEGMKQMQWHELKARGELLMLGNVTVEQLVGNRAWAERFRARAATAGYTVRELINVPYETAKFTNNEAFLRHYVARTTPKTELPINTPMMIYNNTVATYQCSGQERFGVEIISQSYAETMRHVFEHFWATAAPTP
jgi:predicted DNA-binding transcriptional regulator